MALRGRDPYVIHYVHDMKRALAFYRDVFEATVTSESRGWSTLEFESFTLALHIIAPGPVDGHDDEAPLPHAGLNLLVDSIEFLQTRIEAAGGSLVLLREPQAGVPVRVAAFRDSEGNGFELRQEPGETGGD
jgi:predicted enzyme related to lactoylglutathione lyase